ncbi:sperm-associated antigen 7 homolog [Clavelina lepadiformis]|uniref:R3H domain-containing protein n=1 Tax=Clavelina lepadiformis TaxID=159417 RepID=A0ABP0FG34_CLALP
MADLLGSILGSMEKPPSVPESVRKKAKEEEAKLEKLKKQNRLQKEKFQKEIQTAISDFAKNSSETRKSLKPMNKLERSLVHEMAEEAGLTSQAFGVEEHDRHVMLFKKDHPPSEEEIDAYKRGEIWSNEKAEALKQQKVAQEERLKADENPTPLEKSEPTSNYKDKYNHLIGTSAAKDAARKTEANKSFGMVPSRNKRDQRSIEETLNEIRAKKKQKVQSNADDP